MPCALFRGEGGGAERILRGVVGDRRVHPWRLWELQPAGRDHVVRSGDGYRRAGSVPPGGCRLVTAVARLHGWRDPLWRKGRRRRARVALTPRVPAAIRCGTMTR